MADVSSEFNVPEFPEYDPTPYDGGFDLALTYGKPLPPSDAICYPRSVSDPNSPSLDGFSYGSITSPYGKDTVDHTTRPQNGTQPTRPYKEEEEEKQRYDGDWNWLNGQCPDYRGDDNFSNGYGGYDNGLGNDYGKPKDSLEDNGYSEIFGPQPGYDNCPWSGYGYGGEEHGYDYGRQESQPPCSDPPNDAGPCAGLFGYFPCLSQKDQKSYGQQDGNEQGCGNQWKETVEYFFGSSNPYGERRDEGVSYGDPNFAYERHYLEQPHYVQEEYNERSWFQKPSYNEAYQEEDYPLSKYVSSERRDEVVSYGGLNFAYERHYPEQPHYVQEEYNERSGFQKSSYCEAYQEEDYPLSKYVSSQRRDEVVSYGDPNFSYERHYPEQPHYVQEEYNEQLWFKKLSCYESYQEEDYPLSKYVSSERRDEVVSYGDLNFAYERHYPEQPHYVQDEYNERSWFQKPSYYEGYQEEDYPRSKYVSSERRDEIVSYGDPNFSYERHYPEQPHYVQDEYNERSWFQKPSCYEAYQEEDYPRSKYGDDSYDENSEYFYYHQHKYSDYDG